MKRTLIALAVVASAFALSAPASADTCVPVLNFTGRPLVCINDDVIGG